MATKSNQENTNRLERENAKKSKKLSVGVTGTDLEHILHGERERDYMDFWWENLYGNSVVFLVQGRW